MSFVMPAFLSPAPLRLGDNAPVRLSVCARRRPRACTNSEEDVAAWAAWHRARLRPEQNAESAAPRDPEAETEFWRGAAREIEADRANSPDSSSPGSTQSELWANARDVTAGVEAMQQRLADELEAYDPAQALQDYRGAARELTDSMTPTDVDEDDPDQWDPDKAWADFNAAVAASDAERKAREARNAATAFDYSPTFTPPVPTTSTEQPSQPAQQKQPVAEPSTYAGGIDSSDNFEQRDPKKETDFWRSAARELIPDQPPTREVLEYDFTESEAVGKDPEVNDSTKPTIPDWTTPLADEQQPRAGSGKVESSPWDAWHKANTEWAKGLGLEGGPFTADNAARSSDWGAGLRNTGSDAARWRAWDNAVAPKVVKRENKRSGGAGALGEDTLRWMQAARQVTGKEQEPKAGVRDDQTGGVPRGQVGLGVGVEFWTKAAREIVPPDLTENIDTNEGQEGE